MGWVWFVFLSPPGFEADALHVTCDSEGVWAHDACSISSLHVLQSSPQCTHHLYLSRVQLEGHRRRHGELDLPLCILVCLSVHHIRLSGQQRVHGLKPGAVVQMKVQELSRPIPTCVMCGLQSSKLQRVVISVSNLAVSDQQHPSVPHLFILSCDYQQWLCCPTPPTPLLSLSRSLSLAHTHTQTHTLYAPGADEVDGGSARWGLRFKSGLESDFLRDGPKIRRN